MTNLSSQQSEAIEAIARWYESARDGFSSPFRLFGPAGTGKTTLARAVGERLGVTPVFGAYTGKAAKVLNSKGCPATTIHSAVYRPTSNEEARVRLEEAREELLNLELDTKDPVAAGWASALELAGAVGQLREEIAELEEQIKRVGFVWNPESEWAYADLIILDEVSMVDAKMAEDIERFGVPVLVLGDPAQLPPIGGEGYYTGAVPDYELTEIHRQALDSPVLALATRVRQSTGPRLGLLEGDRVKTDLEAAMAADQVLVWKNATRWNLTNAIRRALGRPVGQVVQGDRVMCLTNNKELGILNGTQYDVLEVEPGPLGPRLLLDELDSPAGPRWIKTYAEGFGGLEQEKMLKGGSIIAHRGERGAFTFANVITVHKAQGSEWSSVYVVDQTGGVMAMARREKGELGAIEAGRRWLYTAATRASENLTIAVTPGR